MEQQTIDTAASQTPAEGSSSSTEDSSQNATEGEAPAIDWEARAKKAEAELTRKTDSDGKAEQGRTKARSKTDELLRDIGARLALLEQDGTVIAQSLESGDHEGLASKLRDAKAVSNQNSIEEEGVVIRNEIQSFLGDDSPINSNTTEVMLAAAEFNAAQSRGDRDGMRNARNMVENAYKNANEIKTHTQEIADRDKTIADLKASQRTESDVDNLDIGPRATSAGVDSLESLLAKVRNDEVPFEDLAKHEAAILAAAKREAAR